MKKIFALFFYITSFFVIYTAQEKLVRGSLPHGFFSEFLRVVNHLEYCLAYNKTPVVYWGQSSAYYVPKGYNDSYNVWEYYFEPVSNLSYEVGDRVHTQPFYGRNNNFCASWWYGQYIMYKSLLPEFEQHALKDSNNHEQKYLTAAKKRRERGKTIYPVGKYHLYDPLFRAFVYTHIIDKFIKIKPSIQKKISDFYTKNMYEKKTIGIHLRGNHESPLEKVVETFPVALSSIFDEANKSAEGNVQFFIATDQLPLLQKAQKQLKGKVIYYPCQRFDKTTAPYPGVKLDPKLGEDLLVEAILLSRCDHFIHTLSNVSTAVLYFNPALTHTLIY